MFKKLSDAAAYAAARGSLMKPVMNLHAALKITAESVSMLSPDTDTDKLMTEIVASLWQTCDEAYEEMDMSSIKDAQADMLMDIMSILND